MLKNLIRPWRRLYEIKQERLARETGIHAVSLSRIENGTEPSVTNALKICGALSQISGRSVLVEHVFHYSDSGADIALAALQDASNEVHIVGRVARATRGTEPTPLLDAAPFAVWLRWLMDREQISITEATRRLGISEKTARGVLKGGGVQVQLATVERALVADDEWALRDVYPALFEDPPM